MEAPGWSHRQQMALVNTVAFRGVWQKQFQFANTQNLPFTRSDGSSIKVPMMYQATEVSFGKRGHLSACFTDAIVTGSKVSKRLCRPVQDLSGAAVHGTGAALSGPHAEPAGGPAQREEDAALLPGVPAHGPAGGVLGLGPAQDQDGYFPPQVTIAPRPSPSVENGQKRV